MQGMWVWPLVGELRFHRLQPLSPQAITRVRTPQWKIPRDAMKIPCASTRTWCSQINWLSFKNYFAQKISSYGGLAGESWYGSPIHFFFKNCFSSYLKGECFNLLLFLFARREFSHLPISRRKKKKNRTKVWSFGQRRVHISIHSLSQVTNGVRQSCQMRFRRCAR